MGVSSVVTMIREMDRTGDFRGMVSNSDSSRVDGSASMTSSAQATRTP